MIIKFPDNIPVNLVDQIKSIEEEKANMYSHLLGLAIFFLGSLALVYQAMNSSIYTLTGIIIFCVGLNMVYLSSTWYHASYKLEQRRKLRIFDHVSIYFLIAGTYTPFLMTFFQDNTGKFLLILLWTIVLLGTLFKLFFTHKFNVLSTLAYLAMGWMAIFIINPIIERLPSLSLTWIVIGGISYSIGVIFYLRNSLKYNHFIWHIFVLFGSLSHFIAVWIITT